MNEDTTNARSVRSTSLNDCEALENLELEKSLSVDSRKSNSVRASKRNGNDAGLNDEIYGSREKRRKMSLRNR